MLRSKHVAVIGAGPAGLCAARHLLHSNPNANVVIKPCVFELNSRVGGTWLYEDIIDRNDTKCDVFSSIYKNLKTNLPKQVMAFPDFPFPDAAPSFLHHSLVLKYLEDYTNAYNLNDVIRFDTTVVNVSPTSCGGEGGGATAKWSVTSTNKNNETLKEEYDAVVVCNGHFSKPSSPNITGLHNFHGETIHSHYYRDPSEFNGKTVLILGCGPSGQDIMAELCEHCDTVYMSHRGNRLESVLPDNVVEVPNISHVDENGHFVFEDSSTADVDVFLPCTGYTLNLPFLSPQCGIDTEDNTILNLYKHIFSIKHPSLSFVGLTWKNAPLPSIHQQCLYITKVISESKQLPSVDDMMKDTDDERTERQSSGELNKYFHRMGDRQWTYNRDIAALAGNVANPVVIEKLYKYVHQFRRKDICAYKRMEFETLNESEFIDLTKHQLLNGHN